MKHFAAVTAIFVLEVTFISSQRCRSYNRQQGACVSIERCPPLIRILKNNPTRRQLIKLQRLTCVFDERDPKICCPISLVSPKINITSARVPPTIDFKSHKAFNSLPKINECGIAKSSDRLIGGKNVSLGTYPWMARIGFKRGKLAKKLEYFCGGTIIGKRLILTAAHCTEGMEEDYGPIQVRVGEYNTDTNPDCDDYLHECSFVKDFKIKELLNHQKYNSNTKQNDISLILLDEDIEFNDYFIQPICLPFIKEYGLDKFPEKDSFGIVAGWGRTHWNKKASSKILQHIRIPLTTNRACQALYNKRVAIKPNQLCAGGEAGQDSCGGDSGGPLMYLAKSNKALRYFQIGVVSYGPVQCGIGGLPGVYSRVTSYLEWILDTIAANT